MPLTVQAIKRQTDPQESGYATGFLLGVNDGSVYVGMVGRAVAHREQLTLDDGVDSTARFLWTAQPGDEIPDGILPPAIHERVRTRAPAYYSEPIAPKL